MQLEAEIKPFLQSLKVTRNLDSKTIKAYECDLTDFVSNVHFNSEQPLTQAMLERYFSGLQRRNLKGTTVKRRLASLRQFLRYLDTRDGSDFEILLRPFKKIRQEKRLPRTMPLRHLEAMLNAVGRKHAVACIGSYSKFKYARDLAILELLFATGMRSCEAIALDLDDIDIAQGALLVNGKGRRQRMLYIPHERTSRALSTYMEERSQRSTDSTALFINRAGRRLNVQTVALVFRQAKKTAGITEHCTPHSIRHTVATQLIENGADIRSVQEILGHRSILTTQIYLSVTEQRKREVLRRFHPARERSNR